MARAIMLVLPNFKFGAHPSGKFTPVSSATCESQNREDETADPREF
jgi:hypothetical protein